MLSTNLEKALVGAFSVILKTDCGTDGSFYSTIIMVLMSPTLYVVRLAWPPCAW